MKLSTTVTTVGLQDRLRSMKTALQVHQVTWRNDLIDSLQRKDTEIETSQNEAYGQESSSLGQANMGSTSTYHKVIVIHMGIQDRQLTLITIHPSIIPPPQLYYNIRIF